MSEKVLRPRKPFPEMVAKLSDSKLLALAADLEAKIATVAAEAKLRTSKPSALAALAVKFG